MPDDDTIALQALEESLAKPDLSPECRQLLEMRRDTIEQRMINNGQTTGKKATLVKNLKKARAARTSLKKARAVRIRDRQKRRQEMLAIIEQLRSRGMQWSKIALRLGKEGYLAHGGLPYTAKALMNLYGKRERE